jgi:predicted dehydrogenase
MRIVGAAVAGTGFIGPVHVEALRRLGHRVVGVLGSSPEKGKHAADVLGVPTAYGSFDDLLADPAVEVVHLATPNRDHFDQCRRAIAAGKHVVCEKPLAMTSAETAELVRLAAANPGLVTAVNYNVRFYPLCLEAREWVRSGRVGEVFHVTGSYLQDWLLHPTDFNWRVLAEHGGELRAVADIGTHWLDLLTFITGLEVEAVCADLRTVHPVRQRPTGGSETFTGSASGDRPTTPVPVTTEDYGSILLRFRRAGGVNPPSSASGCLTVSQATAGRKNCLRFDVAGGAASLAWDSEEPNVLRVGRRDRPNERLTRDPALLSPAARRFADYPGGHAEGFPDSFKQLFRAVYDAVASPGVDPRGALYPTFADGHREVLLCEAILRSHREQRWISIPSERGA